jgi:hypothetical protein
MNPEIWLKCTRKKNSFIHIQMHIYMKNIEICSIHMRVNYFALLLIRELACRNATVFRKFTDIWTAQKFT